MAGNLSVTTVVIVLVSVAAVVSMLYVISEGQQAAYSARDYSPIGSCADFGYMKPADYNYWLYGFFKTQSDNVREGFLRDGSYDYDQAVQFCGEYISCTAFSDAMKSDFQTNPISRCCIDLFQDELGGTPRSPGAFGAQEFASLVEDTKNTECPF